MNDSDQSIYDQLSDRYESGDVPWDSADPPPEVMEFLATVPPGQAIDLGCGYGRAAIYMAALGWGVDAIDFITDAITEAARRAEIADVEVRFHHAKVTDLEFLTGSYDFALDVGCSHNLTHHELEKYQGHLRRLIRLNGVFLLFARLQEESAEDLQGGPPGMNPAFLLEIFRDGFELDWMERGRTKSGDNDSWVSAWFQFRRT